MYIMYHGMNDLSRTEYVRFAFFFSASRSSLAGPSYVKYFSPP